MDDYSALWDWKVSLRKHGLRFSAPQATEPPVLQSLTVSQPTVIGHCTLYRHERTLMTAGLLSVPNKVSNRVSIIYYEM